MPITVELQDMHSYSFALPVIVVVFVVLSIAAAVVLAIKNNKNKAAEPIQQITPENRENIKQKYDGQLYRLALKCKDKKISNRRAYQELSRILRHFVYEATGIKVQNYTLQEIQTLMNTGRMNISGLYEVINECYAPEFAIDRNGDIFGSITKARKVIERWS